MRALSRIILAAAAAAVMLLGPAAGQAGKTPDLAWSPTTSSGGFDYGTLIPGQTASQSFTLTNSGGSASSALMISLSGSAAFTITSDGCTGPSLVPGNACSVTVDYAPSTAGESDTATLSASGKRPGTTASLTFTGRAGQRHLYWANGQRDDRRGRPGREQPADDRQQSKDPPTATSGRTPGPGRAGSQT